LQEGCLSVSPASEQSPLEHFSDRWTVRRSTIRGVLGRPPDENAEILLVGLSIDEHLDAIGAILARRGASFAALHTDVDFVGGLNLAVHPGSLRRFDAVLVRSTSLLPVAFHAARVFIEVAVSSQAGPAGDFLRREAEAACDEYLASVASGLWVNDPNSMNQTRSTSLQFSAAARVGLAVPRTVITSDRDQVEAFRVQVGEIVVKPLAHPMAWSDGAEAGFLHTTVLSRREIAGLPIGLGHHALFQERLRPIREYRVMVVGSHVTACALNRVPSDLPDWRRELGDGIAPWAVVDLPCKVAESLVLLMNALHLSYGAVDLMESEDGKWFFLEVNSSGSYLWLERALGLSVSEQIADLLLSDQR
jgi:RimK-like ATP-grasp domain